MTFSSYLDSAWESHAKDTLSVANNFSTGLKLAETNEDLAQLANIVAHVYGQHLGRFQDGVVVLQELKSHPQFKSGSDTDNAIFRATQALQIANGGDAGLVDQDASTQIRILTVAAAALSEHNTAKAKELFLRSLELAKKIDTSDPANRALAITGNNLAAALEEHASRTTEADELMILSAKTGRKYWEIAGTWLEVARAEYRLSMSYLASGKLNESLEHAKASVEICTTNKASSFDMYSGFEAIARIEKALNDRPAFKSAFAKAEFLFEKLSTEDKAWFEPGFMKLKAWSELLKG